METTAFGQSIRDLRGRAAITQAVLAKLIGYSTNTIARWERGELTPHPLMQKMVVKVLMARTQTV